MAISREEILNAIADMPVMEVVKLVSDMEEKFGVSAAAAVAPVAMVGGAEATAAEEQTEFNVMLTEIGSNKIGVIKAIRAITSLGLKEAKDLVDGALPVAVKEGASKEEADNIKKQLEEAGAKAEAK